MNVLDLFSGIGGFSLGLERAGFKTVAFCEIEPYARAVLRKHWPDVPCYEDVRAVTADRLRADGIIAAEAEIVADTAGTRWSGDAGEGHKGKRREAGRFASGGAGVDVICGGFPCQDISVAGKGAGLAGERSGLWSEIARLVGELRPRYVIVENVSALLGRGLGTVLGDLAEIGYDAEWHCIPASYVGAPHRRDRIWIVAYPNGQRGSGRVEPRENVVNHLRESAQLRDRKRQTKPAMADPHESRLEGWLGRGVQECAREWAAGEGRSQWDEPAWFAESGMGRISDGVRNRVDRIRCLGNSVVPQVVEIIGRAIMAAEISNGHVMERDESLTDQSL